MEQREKRRKKLKNRILLNIFFVLGISLIISTFVSYFYFENIVKNQCIGEEKAKLKQLSDQIESMTEDINNFAKSIIGDMDVQEYIKGERGTTEFERAKKRAEMKEVLVFYNSLRTYSWCSSIELNNGENYTSLNLGTEDYLEFIQTIDEIAQFKEHTTWLYSNPYHVENVGNEGELILFRSDMKDVNNFHQSIGTLFIQVHFKYFTDQIDSYTMASENLSLLGSDDSIIYQKGELKEDDGYLLYEPIEGTTWKLCTMISYQYLWEQCQFVFYFFLVTFVITITLVLSITSRFLGRIIMPITELSEHMKKTDYHMLQMEKHINTEDEIQTLYECYEEMLIEIQKGVTQRLEYEKQKTDMRFAIMLSQTNPHYLYNVLNTVVYLAAASRNKEVVEITKALIYTLQETLMVGEGNIETSVEKELELTRNYLSIQKYRYPNMFEVVITCEETLKDCLLPKIVIQPLVENALIHGILPRGKQGTIEIDIFMRDEMLYIRIEDDGIGVAQEAIQTFTQGKYIVDKENGRNHIGIVNVKERIEYLYGEPYGMWILEREEGGTRVILKLPTKRDE